MKGESSIDVVVAASVTATVGMLYRLRQFVIRVETSSEEEEPLRLIRWPDAWARWRSV